MFINNIRQGTGNVNVNNSLSVPDMAFTIAHEFGHHILHQDYARSKDYMFLLKSELYKDDSLAAVEEQEANAFARFLLMPTKSLKRYKDLLSPRDMASLFVVSTYSLHERLKNS